MNAHLAFCESYGISQVDIESTNPSQGTEAFQRFSFIEPALTPGKLARRTQAS